MLLSSLAPAPLPPCPPAPPRHAPQAEAERRLLAAALGDPRNQRFLLASETCTPLYPPHVLYLQLLSETLSRLDACAPKRQPGAAATMPER